MDASEWRSGAFPEDTVGMTGSSCCDGIVRVEQTTSGLMLFSSGRESRPLKEPNTGIRAVVHQGNTVPILRELNPNSAS